MANRVRVETATVRPFSGLSELEKLFEERVAAELAEVELVPAPLPTFIDHDLGDADGDLSVILAENGLEKAPETFATSLTRLVNDLGVQGFAECLRLVVVARAVSLRFATVIGSWTLNDEIPVRMNISRCDDSVKFALQDRRGFDLRVALVLADDLPDAGPLTPALAGTWLAQARFRVRPQPNRGGFAPQELTPEIRRQYSLPDATLSFVAVQQDALLGADDLSEVAVHYWDPDVLRLIQVRPKDHVSRYVQESMAVDLLTSVAGSIAQAITSEVGPDAGIEALKDYPAAEDFIEELTDLLTTTRKTPLTPDDVLKLAGKDLPKLKALIEGEFGVKKVLIDTLRSYQ